MTARYLPILLLLVSLGVVAGIEPRSFDDPRKEALYRHLVGEMRCLVCQNESLAASNADLAQDLREEIYEMVLAGRSEQEIIDYMVQRYGDFVLYRPPVKPETWPLWAGPGLLLLIALFIAWRFLRGRRSGEGEAVPGLERARALLDDPGAEQRPGREGED